MPIDFEKQRRSVAGAIPKPDGIISDEDRAAIAGVPMPSVVKEIPMGWNNAKQFSAKLPPIGMIETGILAFGTTDLTVEVPTKLSKIKGGSATIIDADANQGYVVACGLADTDITAGYVTFVRKSNGSSAQSFTYILIGR